MKSQHRHELAQNDLSKILGRWIEKFDERANTILIAIVVVALIAAGLIFWTRTTANQRENGWIELAACTSPEDFANVADAFAGSPAGAWARLRAANGFLQEGVRLSLSDRPASNERLEQAREAFESLLSGGHPAPIREQSLLGLAVTQESLSDGQTDPAIAAYEKLLSEFPETRFKDWANVRIDALKTGSAQEFYAWFRKQNPKPADMPVPNDSAGSKNSSLDSLLKDLDETGIPTGSRGNPFDSTPLTVPLSSDGGGSKATDENPANPFATDPATAGEEVGGKEDATAEPNSPAEDGAPDTAPADNSPDPGGEPAPPKPPE
ncbi:MAG: tol-pal system YbgF family protein [Planctomycetaceae bacterium]